MSAKHFTDAKTAKIEKIKAMLLIEVLTIGGEGRLQAGQLERIRHLQAELKKANQIHDKDCNCYACAQLRA